MEKSNTNNFWQWLISHKNQYHYLSLLEQWGSIGHPTHPNPKTKIELSLPEVLRYSPDLNSEFVISFAALHRSCAYQQNQDKSNNINQIFANQFPDVYANWHHALLENDCHPENYWIVPVHPWQKRNILLKKFQPLIQQKKLLFLAVVLPVKPTASFRTLIAASPHSSPHIKLPLGVRITSVPRTVSPGTTRMSPRMSDLLEKILLQENHFSKRLYFCRDMAGVHVTHPHAAHDDLRHLSTLIRENPLTLIDQDDIIVPLTALFANSPGSSAPLLHEIMQTAKIENMIEPLPYFFNYIHITLQAILDLYLIYGIALEAHKQNTLLVFKNNNPTRIIYRDFGGIRIHYPTLQAQHYSLEIDVPTLIVTDDEKAARHKIIHTVYQDHFISLVNFFHYYYSIEKNILWRAIAQETQQRFYSVRERISPQRYQQEYQGILQENWLIKSFTRMRLHNTNDYIHIDSGENPLRMN